MASLFTFFKLPTLFNEILTRTVAPTRNLIEEAILNLNRNAREPKKANHGARPNSSVMRRMKKKTYYRRWKENTPYDEADLNQKE